MGWVLSFLWFLLSVVISALVTLRGLNKNSLSETGATAALIVGIIHFYCGPRFGLTMLAFYLSSSKLTKFKAELKEVLEENYKKASRRGAVQVLANSLTSSVLVIIAARNVGKDQRTVDAALAGVLGHFACCCADTWSSEVGVVANENPKLITTLKTVPKGTNGAISFLGTAAGAAGGLFVGLVYWVTGWLDSTSKDSSYGISFLFLGLLYGLLGTGLDSLLGGTLQYTGHSQTLKKVVNKPGPEVTHIAGRDILSNEAVNFISSAAIAWLAYKLG